MTMSIDAIIKELDISLNNLFKLLKDELAAIRGSRPSVALLENVKVNYYDQVVSLKQLGSFGLKPPREIEIHVWDKNSVQPVMKAVEEAKIGMTITNDGNVIRAILPALTEERRQELIKLSKKTTEEIRIQLRAHRDEAVKKLKTLEEKKEITQDYFFQAKEKIQKIIDETNKGIETALNDKIREIEG